MNYQSTSDNRRRRDAGIAQITERDISSLSWIAQQYCISFDHLRLLLGRDPKASTKEQGILSISATRHAVERWIQLELVEEPRKLLASHAPYIWLSRRGLTQLNLPFGYYQPKPSMIAHLYALNSIRLHFERISLPVTWYSRRLLIRMSNHRPTPDAELHTGTVIIAVQLVERQQLQALTLKEEIDILQQLATRNYSYFWYFLHTETIPLFQQALLQLDRELRQRVLFYALDARRIPKRRKHAPTWTDSHNRQPRAEPCNRAAHSPRNVRHGRSPVRAR